MGYLRDDRLKNAMINMEDGLFKAMCILDTSGGLIDTWSFDNDGKINLFQDRDCGCKRFLNKIDIGLNSEDINNGIIKDEEFIEQIEDLLLEVNYKHNLDNFLFNSRDIFSITQSCEICDN